jgi:coproporphyrinogen III oxidase-like Fe-S oxidoreductase
MIRISVQVSSGTARFRVAVQAETIERALKSVARQYPGKVCEVTFPIDPETYFAEDSVDSVKQLAA